MGAKIPSNQRQLSLLLALTLPTYPLTKQQLFKQVLGYNSQVPDKNLERMFSRDKQVLEQAGCHITVSQDRQGRECYRIHVPNQNWYEAFTATERELLRQAMDLWHHAAGSGSLKIRATTSSTADQPLLSVRHSGLSNPQVMAQLLDAILARKQVKFSYPSAEDPHLSEVRLVEPWRLLASDSQILLHAWDCVRQGVRHFNLSRIGQDFTITDQAATIAVDLSAKLSLTQIEPLLAVRSGHGGAVENRTEPLPDATALAPDLALAGWELRRGRSDTYRHWWHTLMAEAENCVVLEPSYLRADVVESLQHTASLAPDPDAEQNRGNKRVRTSRQTTLVGNSTLELTLALVQWLQTSGPATVDEAAHHFGVSRQDILNVTQYLADTFFENDYFWTKINLRWDLFYDDEILDLEPSSVIDNIVQLTVTEARAALIALWLYAHLTSGVHNQVLLPAVAKLSSHLEAENLQNVLVWIESPDEQALRSTIWQARETEKALGFTYISRDGEKLPRLVLPEQLTYADGHWVLRGYCFRTGQTRSFRCDRMQEVALRELPPADAARAVADSKRQEAAPVGERVQVKVEPRWVWALTEERSEGRANGVFYLNVYDQRWGSDQLLTLGAGVVECDHQQLCQQAATRAQSALENYRQVGACAG